MQRITNYINGAQVEPLSGNHLDDVDPATGRVYAHVPDSDAADVERAVEAARAAFASWSSAPAEVRAAVLLRLADRLEADLARFADAECVDTGKPLTLARSLDIPRAVRNLRFFATAVLHFHSESHATDEVALNYTLREPRGVVGAISPWNLPLYLLTWKIAPALATGNTVVAKPSEVTPMTAFLFSQLCQEVSLPPGVLNIVHGSGASAGAALAAHPDVGTITFTGGTRTGAEIARVAGPMFKKLALEMGGKNPNIVFADADPAAALEGSVRAAFANQGQVCLCGSRLFVERSVYDSFVERFVTQVKGLRVGDPLEPETDQGAVVSAQHLKKIRYYVELARQEGGTILCGGQSPGPINARCAGGFFFEPTVVAGLGVDCRVNREEIFGPVVSIVPFEDEEQVVEYANATEYGLSASVWTRDVGRAHRVARGISSGTVWVNCWLLRDLRVPFGGMKSSGVGREGGEEALRFFTEAKNVCVKVES